MAARVLEMRRNKVQKQAQSASYQQHHKVGIDAPELKDKYRILNKIDYGGYAIVYKAIALSSTNKNHFVAIKRVHCIDFKSYHTQQHPMIEAKILQEFTDHKHFPTLHCIEMDTACGGGAYSIVMEYFEHQPFPVYNDVLTEAQTIRYMFTLLQCIDALSQKGYVHRDIKPNNFLYNMQTQRFLLIDFGLCQMQSCIANKHKKEYRVSMRTSAARTSIAGTRQTHRTTLCQNAIRQGTPGFRAPEIVLACNAQDSRIDVFSAGVILACIMLGVNKIFHPSNDYEQLLEFISVYGWRTVSDTARALHRNIEMRGLSSDVVYCNNSAQRLQSDAWLSGFEDQVQKYACLAHWVRTRLGRRLTPSGPGRKWSKPMYHLLKKLTAFNPKQRPSSAQALQHKVFATMC